MTQFEEENKVWLGAGGAGTVVEVDVDVLDVDVLDVDVDGVGTVLKVNEAARVFCRFIGGDRAVQFEFAR